MKPAFGETVTVIPQTADNWGNRTPGESYDVEGCASWALGRVTSPVLGGTESTVVGEDTLVWDLTILMPTGTPVTSTDQVVIDGVTYEVVSRPIAWASFLTNRKLGVEVHLKAVQG